MDQTTPGSGFAVHAPSNGMFTGQPVHLLVVDVPRTPRPRTAVPGPAMRVHPGERGADEQAATAHASPSRWR